MCTSLPPFGHREKGGFLPCLLVVPLTVVVFPFLMTVAFVSVLFASILPENIFAKSDIEKK